MSSFYCKGYKFVLKLVKIFFLLVEGVEEGNEENLVLE